MRILAGVAANREIACVYAGSERSFLQGGNDGVRQEQRNWQKLLAQKPTYSLRKDFLLTKDSETPASRHAYLRTATEGEREGVRRPRWSLESARSKKSSLGIFPNRRSWGTTRCFLSGGVASISRKM